MKQALTNVGKRLYRRLTFANNRERAHGVAHHLQRVDFQLGASNVLLHSLQRAQLEQFERELLQEARYTDAKKLNRYEYQFFSQFGEDGIIAEIFRRIGATSRFFVEIGVGDGLENNTAALLFQGWSGCWVEGGEEEVEAIHANLEGPLSQDRLKVVQSFVTAENIAQTLREMQTPAEVDLLSVDIDRNTYYIWEALAEVKARVVVVEYNSQIPADVNWKIDYDPEKMWNNTAYYSASLKALEELGRELGYSLVGCNLAGANAFFVREELCDDHFLAPFTSENHYEPARHFLFRKNGHPISFSDKPQT